MAPASRMAVTVTVLAVLACADVDPGPVPEPEGCASFAGTWNIVTTVDKRACDEGIEENAFTVELTQDGCTVFLPVSWTARLEGTVTGDTARITGSYGQLDKTDKDLSLVIDGDTLSGTGRWTWSALGLSCSGSETLSGKRQRMSRD